MLEAFDDIDQDWLLNTQKLDLQGKYVLVDFWTYSCINCLRTIPQLEEIHRNLSSNGLAVVGVHTPEFDFEKIPSNVFNAAKELGITYPVVLDQEYYLWAYFNNQYWPAHYLFDREGELIFESIGENGSTELLNVLNELFGNEITDGTHRKEGNVRVTPEIYLGKNRGELGNSAVCLGQSCNTFILPDRMETGKAYLEGEWLQHQQYIESLGKENRINVGFMGNMISGVLDSASEANVLCEVDGNKTEIPIDGPNSYNICETGYVEKNLVLTVPKGVRVYTLTFG